MKLTHIINKANINQKAIKAYLDFLFKQEIVEEQPFKKGQVAYAISLRGIRVLKYFRELTQVQLVIEKA
jgi:predicted transcriptional regulator